GGREPGRAGERAGTAQRGGSRRRSSPPATPERRHPEPSLEWGQEAIQRKASRAGDDQARETRGLGPELERGWAEQQHSEQSDDDPEDDTRHGAVRHGSRVRDHEQAEDEDLRRRDEDLP